MPAKTTELVLAIESTTEATEDSLRVFQINVEILAPAEWLELADP
jgi:hypothetical protein